MYERSSKHNFSLAEYNLGHMFEEENKIEESIKFYILSSEHEQEPLIFRDINHFDKRLEISKTFISCFTNLKLVDYYFSLLNYSKSKKYFIKLIDRLRFYDENSNYSFRITILKDKYSKDIFS